MISRQTDRQTDRLINIPALTYRQASRLKYSSSKQSYSWRQTHSQIWSSQIFSVSHCNGPSSSMHWHRQPSGKYTWMSGLQWCACSRERLAPWLTPWRNDRHDDVTTWKLSRCCWPFVWGIRHWPAYSPHKRPVMRTWVFLWCGLSLDK